MYRYIIQRILLVVPTLFGAAALVFLLMRLIPGDICVVRLGSGGGTFDERAVTACHAELGLDHPVWRQFFDFVWGALHFDFGISMWSGKPVSYEIAARFPISLEIAILATVVAVVIAIPFGTISALKQNSAVDLVVRTFAIAGLATPSFWLGILIILAILDISQAAFGAPWMPPIDYVPLWKDPVRNLSMAIWPAIAVGYRTSAVTMRMTRSAMLEVMREDYIRTARAKGLIERIVVNRHALKNALLPVVTLIGIEFGVPDRRPGRDRAGVQPERDWSPARPGRAEPGLHPDPGIGDADRRRLRADQHRRRPALCLARPPHPLRVTAMTVAAPHQAAIPAILDDVPGGRRSLAGRALVFARHQPLGSFGLMLVLIMAVAGIGADWIAPYSPTANDFAAMTEAPSWAHWLGTDQFGRDQLSRIIFGARTALIVGFSCAFVSSFAGLVLGVGSAYFGGRIDLYLQRLLDILMAFPLIIMALAVVSIFGTGVHNVIMAITIPLIPRCARIIRSSALSIREVPYVDAARACGFSHSRIILRHMVPNVMAPFLILLTAFVGQAILAEASLSYLGLGVQEPVPAWGLMLQGGAEEYASTAPWIAIFPGLAIAVTVFGFSLYGDALRDVLDPKLRDR